MRRGLEVGKFSAALSVLVVAFMGGPIAAQMGGDGPPPGGDGFPVPCGLECMGVAMDAARACKDAGGDLMTCTTAFMDALQQCRADAGCETPERPPVCGEDCLTNAREAAKACKADGDAAVDDVAACLTAVKEELTACLEAAGCELPRPPDMPPICGMSCLRDALAAGKACLQDGGKLLDCATAFRDALEACRATEGCGKVEEPPPAGEDAQVLGLALEETFVRGDANGDGIVDISDPVSILRYLFLGTASPTCLDAADAGDDGEVNISDPVLILATLFEGAASLPAPYPDAGFDPTEDGFVCGLKGP